MTVLGQADSEAALAAPSEELLDLKNDDGGGGRTRSLALLIAVVAVKEGREAWAGELLRAHGSLPGTPFLPTCR
jgi:hypothetical protein